MPPHALKGVDWRRTVVDENEHTRTNPHLPSIFFIALIDVCLLCILVRVFFFSLMYPAPSQLRPPPHPLLIVLRNPQALESGVGVGVAGATYTSQGGSSAMKSQHGDEVCTCAACACACAIVRGLVSCPHLPTQTSLVSLSLHCGAHCYGLPYHAPLLLCFVSSGGAIR